MGAGRGGSSAAAGGEPAAHGGGGGPATTGGGGAEAQGAGTPAPEGDHEAEAAAAGGFTATAAAAATAATCTNEGNLFLWFNFLSAQLGSEDTAAVRVVCSSLSRAGLDELSGEGEEGKDVRSKRREVRN